MVSHFFDYLLVGELTAIVAAALLLRRWWYGLVASAILTALWLALTGVSSITPYFQIVVTFGSLIAVYSIVYAGKRLVIWSTKGWLNAATALAIFGFATAAVLTALAELAPAFAPGPVKEVVREVKEIFEPTCSPAAVRAVPVPELPDLHRTDPPREPVLAAIPQTFASIPIVTDHWDHFIGPYASIRTSNPTRYIEGEMHPFGVDVVLTIVVDERGDVRAAVPFDGPKVFYEEAVRIARRWKFEPFLLDGKPSVVRIESIGVSIEGPERRKSGAAPFPAQVVDWSSLRIRLLHRVHGFGGRVYDLTIRGDGSVVYRGEWAVALTGRHCAVVSRRRIERLVEEFRRADFFSLDDRYVANAHDFNSVELAISFDGHAKAVYNYGSFLLDDVPDAVIWLPHLTAHAVQAQRWTRGNAYTAPSLLAERWDFARSDEANKSILNGIATFGDSAAMRDLIKAGAFVPTGPFLGVGYFDGATPLEIAALRGELEMVRVLLATPARWRQGSLTSALISVARFGDVATVDRLLSRGADVNGRDMNTNSQTPLMNAAEAGVPGVVERLLRAKPAVGLRDDFGRVALHWAVPWDGSRRPTVVGVDRRRVVELLVAAGADVNARDKGGNTPLFSAWTEGEAGAAALIALGADVNARNNDARETPLMVCRNPNVTRMLLEAGADPYARNSNNKTALDLARMRDKGGDVVAVLERWMAAHPERRPK